MIISLRKTRQLIFGCCLVSGIALAQIAPAPGLNFKLGDDVQTVKTALRTNLDPETSDAVSPFLPNLNKSTLHLRTKGITVVFDRKGVAESIRMDESFSGTVAGIKLGDAEATIKKVLGKPVRPAVPLGANSIYMYALDDSAYFKVELNDANGVISMTILK